MASMTCRVVRAHLNDHEVVAVNCSPLATKPWTAVDVVKGWTIACREDELTDPQPLECGAPVNTGGKAPGVGETITVTMPPGTTEEEAKARVESLGERLLRSITEPLIPVQVFEEDRWRITSCDDDPYTGEAPEAWAYFADRIDRYGFVDRIEHHVNGSWRIRSLRDLLEAAGGDPL